MKCSLLIIWDIFLTGCFGTCCHWILLENPTAVSVWECVCPPLLSLPPPSLTSSLLAVWSKPACPLTGMKGCAIKATNLISPGLKFYWRNSARAFLKSLFFFFACETFQNLPFKQLNHTFATRRGGIKKLSSSLSIFLSLPLPKKSASLRQHQSFQQSPRNIHSPFFSLFLPRCLFFWIIIQGSHSLCTASRQMTHLSRIPWVQ